MNDDIHSLIGAYAVDAVSEQERADFERHLEACSDCRSELQDLQSAAGLIGTTAQATPPAGLRDSVLSQIHTVRPLPPIVDEDDGTAPSPTPLAQGRGRHRRSVSRRVQRWAATAVAAAAIIVAGIAWHPWTSNEPTQVSAVQQVLQAPDAHRYVKHLDGATATVVFSRTLGESVLVTKDMAPAPPGHTYQIWYMTSSGKAIGAGFITPEPGSDRQRVLLKGNADQAAAVGVTVEPQGGSPKPTTKPLMVVQLST